MSYRLTAAAISADVATAPQKMVLIVLADMADDAGKCWPSLGLIATRAAMSRKSVIDQIPKLEAAGHLTVNRDGRHNVYRVHPAGSVTHGDQSPKVITVVTHGDHHQSPTVTSPVTHGDPNQSRNRSLNQSVDRPHAPPPAPQKAGGFEIDTFDIPEPRPKAQPVTKSSRPKHEADPEAVAVTLPPTASAKLREAWTAWQQYRQRRASAKRAADRIPWTGQAARLTADQIIEYAGRLGERIVCDRITSAINGEWRGPNLDTLETPKQHDPHQPRFHGRVPNRNGTTGPLPQAVDLNRDRLPPRLPRP
jgi:hypothetical protein